MSVRRHANDHFLFRIYQQSRASSRYTAMFAVENLSLSFIPRNPSKTISSFSITNQFIWRSIPINRFLLQEARK